MSFTKNSKFYLLSGLLLAGVAGFGSWVALDKTQNLVDVVVATQPIPPYTQVTSKMVKTEKVAALGRSENAIDNPDLVIGGYTTTRVFAGQTIIQPMVLKQFDQTGASGRAMAISGDMRAFAIPIEAGDAVSGIRKGDHVDLIATFDGSTLGVNSNITKAIVQNVEIFDVDGDIIKSNDSEKAITEAGYKNIREVTVLLKLDQIETVKHVLSVTKKGISIVLSPATANPNSTRGVTNKNLCNMYGFSGCK